MKHSIVTKLFGGHGKNQLICWLILSLLSTKAIAQQPQVYNQFFMNPYVYNPAYAGVEGHTVFFLMYRQQWTNIQGAPQTMHASFHVPLDGGIALGASAFNVSQGLLSTSAGKISAGYLVNIDRTHFLRFGLSLGGGINSVNITEFDAPDDPAFANFLEQNSFLIGDFGLTYHFGHFNVGFSIPNLFTYDVITQTDFAPVKVTPLQNVLFKVNYRGHINDDFAIEPHFIYRYSQELPHQYEGTVIAHLKHIMWVGASWRQDEGLIGLVGAKVKEKIGIGFAYELGNPEISGDLGPTYELNIGYHLGTKKEHAEHISSFIKSHRLSAEERAKKAELERQKQIAALQSSRANTGDTEDQLGIVGQSSPPLSNTNTSSEGDTQESETSSNDTNSDSQTNSGDNNTSSNGTPSNPTGGGLATGAGVTPTGSTASNGGTTQGQNKDWDHQEDHETLERTNQFGESEVGIRLEKPNNQGGSDVVLSWVPVTDAESMTVADDGHIERELPDGTKEIGVKYERVNADGTKENVIKWDPVINETQAQTIVSNPEMTEAEHEQVAKSDPTLTQDFRTHEDLATSNDHVVVRRGNHLLELPLGNFVIAGAFSEFIHAENFSDELFEQGFHDTIVGYSTARGYYYVVVFRSGNVTQARSRRDELRKLPVLSNAWVLQVTE